MSKSGESMTNQLEKYHISGGEIFDKAGTMYDLKTIIDILNQSEIVIQKTNEVIDTLQAIREGDNKIIGILLELRANNKKEDNDDEST